MACVKHCRALWFVWTKICSISQLVGLSTSALGLIYEKGLQRAINYLESVLDFSILRN